jgi:hypothetical protein
VPGFFIAGAFVARLFFSGPFDFQARFISDDAVILRGQWLAVRL